MRTVLLLLASNVFMTAAWYGHLRDRDMALWKAIAISWGIAFFEYCLQVPANRWGYESMSAYQLKVLQEVITLLVFVGFAWFWLGERMRWNHALAGVLLVAAVAVVFLPPSGGDALAGAADGQEAAAARPDAATTVGR